MPTYGRLDVAGDRGEGCYLYATDGRKFLDFTSGIAVTSLGHCHPHLIKAVTEQAQKLWHSSNLFQIPGQQRLAERLTANSFADTVFFNNSGAEAVELSIKVARKYQSETGHPERYRVIGCHGSFHGRSFATLAAAGAEGYLKGFGPPMDGFDHVGFNNLNEMRAAVSDQTAAILAEPGQRGARRHARTELLRAHAAPGPAAAEQARGADRRLSEIVRRIARLGAPARHPLPARADGRRFRREAARRGAAVPDRGRQCAAHPAAARRR